MSAQPAILEPIPALGRYAFFQLGDAQGLRASLEALLPWVDGRQVLAAVGRPLVDALGCTIEGLRPFPDQFGPGAHVPSTPAALLLWLRTDAADAGALLHRCRMIERALAPGLVLDTVVDAFRHDQGRDLTGYEDGTENPQGAAAVTAALLQAGDSALDGASFVAVQQWEHDFQRLDQMSPAEQDHAIGRRRGDNEELDDAPASAHVKRTAQENFAPEAFVLRRSMPWVLGRRAGLMFVAFGRSLDAFEVQLRRMAGWDDGITDALFGFSRPVSGAYFWCPPMRDGRLNLGALGL